MTYAQTQAQGSVCVIDNDVAIRKTLDLLLTDAGYVVLEAGNHTEAQSLLQSSTEPLVVLLDPWFPGCHSSEVVQYLVHDATLRARHAFILMSTSPERMRNEYGDMLAALKVPVLPMPFTVDEVVEAVQAARQRLEPPAR